MNTGVAVHPTSGLDFESQAVSTKVVGAKCVAQARGDNGRVLGQRWSMVAPMLEAGHAAAEWIAGNRIPTAEVDLAGCPSAPGIAEPGQQSHVRLDDSRPLFSSVGMTPNMRVDAGQVDLRHAKRPPSQLDDVVRWDARLVKARRFRDRHWLFVPIGGLRQGGEVGAKPKPDRGAAAPMARDLAHQVELRGTIEGNPGAGHDRRLEQRPALDRAIHGNQVRWDASLEGGVQLATTEDIASDPFLAQDPTRREGEVRFDGGEDRHRSFRPASSKFPPLATGISAQ